MWAAGVILYILLCGFPPFVSPDNEQEELFERILSGQYEFTSPYWDAISDSAKQLISNMLQAQPELRFSAEDVLDHSWLAVTVTVNIQSLYHELEGSFASEFHHNPAWLDPPPLFFIPSLSFLSSFLLLAHSPCLTSAHIISLRFTSPHLTSPHLTVN